VDENVIRLSVPIEREVNDKLLALLPWGVKAQVIRSLIKLFIDTQIEHGENRWIAEDLIKGRCKLVVQILNVPDNVLTACDKCGGPLHATKDGGWESAFCPKCDKE
jgi:formamidopyrimidine-DNA glycosylase